MKRFHLLFFTLFALLSCLFSEMTQAQVIVPSADDYATLAFQDPWDMNERTDLGWFTFHVTHCPSNLTDIRFERGIFYAKTVPDPVNPSISDPQISLLDTEIPYTASLGKIGKNYPIDADKFTHLMIRMKLDSGPPCAANLIWSKNTIYSGISASHYIWVYGGWNIYFVDIPSLGVWDGFDGAGLWSGMIDSLRFDPTTCPNEQIEIDWIRLVDISDPSVFRTVQWPGITGKVDIYLDNDNNTGNSNLGRFVPFPQEITGNSYSFPVGALPYGTYYFAARRSQTTGSLIPFSDYFLVNDLPTLRFTSPSEEGSDDDFATTQLGNPWDMDFVNDLGYLMDPWDTHLFGDIDYCVGISDLEIAYIDAEDEAGRSLGSIRVLKGKSQLGNPPPPDPHCVGDAYVYPLFVTKRGASTRIDSDRYRILVLEMGLPGDRDLRPEPDGGSIARIVWRVLGEQYENVSQDIILNHVSGSRVVMDKIIADMKALPIELGHPYTSETGWNGMLGDFRVDSHEFCLPREFYIKNIKLAALERANTSYEIKWEYRDQYSITSRTMSLFYDTDNKDYDGILIVSGIDPATGIYSWNTSGVPNGIYYIYALFSDGLNQNQAYGRWPIVIGETAEIIYVAKDRSCGGKSPCFGTIQGGINAATAVATVMISQDAFQENIIINTPKELTFQGGWDSSFTAVQSTTTIQGSLTISGGKVVMNDVTLQ